MSALLRFNLVLRIGVQVQEHTHKKQDSAEEFFERLMFKLRIGSDLYNGSVSGQQFPFTIYKSCALIDVKIPY